MRVPRLPRKQNLQGVFPTDRARLQRATSRRWHWGRLHELVPALIQVRPRDPPSGEAIRDSVADQRRSGS